MSTKTPLSPKQKLIISIIKNSAHYVCGNIKYTVDADVFGVYLHSVNGNKDTFHGLDILTQVSQFSYYATMLDGELVVRVY